MARPDLPASSSPNILLLQYKNDKNLKWAMAGRSLAKLKSVRDAIGAPSDTPLVVADASDAASLKAMVEQTKSVISTVGPYMLYGNELLAACVAAGVDYFDLCGEPIWMRQKIEQHEAAAKASGSRIMFSCGYDSLPFELGVFLRAGTGEEGPRRGGAARQRPRTQDGRHVLRRHRSEHARAFRGGSEGSEPGGVVEESVLADAGL